MSQRYNKLHVLHRKKNEASERSDTRFKGSYELMCNYTKHIPKKLLVWKPYFDDIISL